MFYSCNRAPAYHLSGIPLEDNEKGDLLIRYKESITQKIDEMGALPPDQARDLKEYLARHSDDIFKPTHHIELLSPREDSDAVSHSSSSDRRTSSSFSVDSLEA